MQITEGHTLTLFHSEHDWIDLFEEVVRFSSKPRQASVLLLKDPEFFARAVYQKDRAVSDLPKSITVYSADKLLTDGMLLPGNAIEWLNRERRIKATQGYSIVCFVIDMDHLSKTPADNRSLLVFESALDEFSSANGCFTLACRIIGEDRGRLANVLRASKKIRLDGSIVANPYYTPARDLFGPESDIALFHQMLNHIKTERDRDSIIDSEDVLRALFREIDVGFGLFETRETTKDGEIEFYLVEANSILEDINGTVKGGMTDRNAQLFFPTDSPDIIDIFRETAATGMSARFERYHEGLDLCFEITSFRPRKGLCAALVTDITERKRKEENKQKSEYRVRQTQKMEAIGRLASGVAHDFNNILTAIVGLSNVLMEELPSESSQWEDVSEIKKAADRAASLTRQLAAFSRRQDVSPKIVNLNTVIADSYKMLSRIIGEDISLEFNPGDNLKPVKIDPDQITQVLTNFSANARDAMPQGGRLVISTDNVVVKDHIISIHGDLTPGSYVRLSADDNGIGMTEEVLERIFEPFFTTKDKGKGTGLGLATVYGIVRQNDGVINVISTPGQGTSFRLYFPCSSSRLSDPAIADKTRSEGSGITILFVEDEETVRNLTTRVLERNGYKVVVACCAEDALSKWKDNIDRIDFLLTDVIMPGMNGLELYKTLKKDRLDLKVLYISGYPEEVIADQGCDIRQIELLDKPFSPVRLISRIQDIINEVR